MGDQVWQRRHRARLPQALPLLLPRHRQGERLRPDPTRGAHQTLNEPRQGDSTPPTVRDSDKDPNGEPDKGLSLPFFVGLSCAPQGDRLSTGGRLSFASVGESGSRGAADCETPGREIVRWLNRRLCSVEECKVLYYKNKGVESVSVN